MMTLTSEDVNCSRHQKRTVGNILRLYSHRRRDSKKLDNIVLTPLKRSMSDNGLLNKRNQLKKQAETDSEHDEDLHKSSSPSNRISIESSDRRDSNTSSDSQKSSKKPASINEIQDLYSALQDLVKTNVTTTPLPERRAKMLKTSPMGSPRPTRSGLGERTLTVPEKALRKLSSKISPSSSFEKDQVDTPSKHKRGLSTGTIDAVTNLMKISPFPNRKFSHDVESTTKETKKNSITKNPRTARYSGGFEQKKWRGAKLFNRLRSKSNVELSDDNDDKLSTDDDETTPQNNSRRLSEPDSFRRTNKDHQTNSANRKSLNEDTKREIEQLVASLNLETNNESYLKTPTNSSNNPVDDLNQLESWFEQAAAESLNNRPPSRLQDESSSDANQSPDVKNNRTRKKQSTGNRRGAGIRRASSNAASKNKEERKARRGKLGSKSFDAGGLTHAKSTPDLSNNDDNETLNDKGVTYKVLGQLNHVNNNKTTSDNNKPKKLSLDGTPINRFPECPVFYLPSDNQNEDSSLYEKNNKQSLSMFYSEKENNARNKRSESLSKMKTSNSEKHIQKRPKSMFAYFEEDVLIGDDILTNTESMKNNLNKDNNANFCRAKILNSPHALSLCDLSKTTMVQEKSLWEKFKKTAANKKAKAVVA